MTREPNDPTPPPLGEGGGSVDSPTPSREADIATGDDPLLSSPIHVQALSDLGTARGMIEVMRAALERIADPKWGVSTVENGAFHLHLAMDAIDQVTRIAFAALRRVREVEAAQAAGRGEGRDG